ncbi:hypothetical protein [Rugamonas aquatica]|uniref:hypothetical protein n=1 Tax=Rugamonas aquatica TaxID=2743357 RepID=UPI001F4486D9|nr:hypothetical protein [Rugamonas aquatica]
MACPPMPLYMLASSGSAVLANGQRLLQLACLVLVAPFRARPGGSADAQAGRLKP